MAQLKRYEPSGELHNPWSLLRDINRIFRDDLLPKSIPLVFEASTNNWLPEVDIENKGDSYYIEANTPGLDPKNIEVQLDKNTLTIKGKIEREEKQENKNYLRVERAFGEFNRSFYLPDLDPQADIKAEYKDGVLRITLPKAKSSATRRVEVKAASGQDNNATGKNLLADTEKQRATTAAQQHEGSKKAEAMHK